LFSIITGFFSVHAVVQPSVEQQDACNRQFPEANNIVSEKVKSRIFIDFPYLFNLI